MLVVHQNVHPPVWQLIIDSNNLLREKLRRHSFDSYTVSPCSMTVPPRISNDSGSSGSNALSSSPSSTDTELNNGTDSLLSSPITEPSPELTTRSMGDPNMTGLDIRSDSPNNTTQPDLEHVIQLSSIEHCMPRAYIRICLSYRLQRDASLDDVIEKLDAFVRRTVDAKPYLSGYVVPTRNHSPQVGTVEIRYTDKDFLEYPATTVRHLTSEEISHTYDDLNHMGLPPSIIRPDLVSALPEGADDDRAPVFRVQANVVQGGLIVSIYLHHCISDGTGLGLLVTGYFLNDESSFNRHLEPNGQKLPTLSQRLDIFSNRMTIIRQQLSWSFPNQITTRHIDHKHNQDVHHKPKPTQAPGRGCVFAFSRAKLSELKSSLEAHVPTSFMTSHDVLQAFVWHQMTRARIPSLAKADGIMTSKLLMPVDIRNKLKDSLPDTYFGSAIDFAEAKLPLDHLSRTDTVSWAQTARVIRESITRIDESYVRQAIALARLPDPNIDVRDLLASNMNRITGADMYITSWERLKIYESTLDLGLGQPDWVRKPWSKDPGSCIVLPSDDRKPYLEMVIQMTVNDMERLLNQHEFMAYVMRVVE